MKFNDNRPDKKNDFGTGAPSATDAVEGDTYLDVSSGDAYTYDGSSWVVDGTIGGGVGIFGESYQYAQSLAASSLTGSSWANKMQLTTTSLAAGTYLVVVTLSGATNAGGTLGKIRTVLSGAVTDTREWHLSRGNGSIEDRSASSSRIVAVVATAGTLTIDLDYTGEAVGVTIKISDAMIEVFRIA